MKRYAVFLGLSWIATALGVIGLFFISNSHAQSGGQFELSWSNLGGGGGASGGGPFTMRGTVGQHEPGTMSNGRFQIEGGFWSGIKLVQVSGAPVLKIKLSRAGQAILSWPLNAQGFALEETSTALPPSRWTRTTQTVVDTATEHTVTVPATAVIKSYRLKK